MHPEMVIIIPSMNDIKKRFDVYYAILLFTALSMIIAAFTYNLIILFISFEGVSIATYILTAYNKTKSEAKISAATNVCAIIWYIPPARSSVLT